jgi:hypothetical protein
MSGAAEQRMLRQLSVQAAGGLALCRATKGAALLAQAATQLRTAERAGFDHGCWR